jgi:hypothetical protein
LVFALACSGKKHTPAATTRSADTLRFRRTT